MKSTTVAVDLAKSVFQLAGADTTWRVTEQHRLTRTQLERWFVNRDVTLVIMEACGSAHHFARWLNHLGVAVKPLPAAYISTYVKRNKTDAADACALANKLARIYYATLRDGEPYDTAVQLQKKMERSAYAMLN